MNQQIAAGNTEIGSLKHHLFNRIDNISQTINTATDVDFNTGLGKIALLFGRIIAGKLKLVMPGQLQYDALSRCRSRPAGNEQQQP